MNSLAEEAFKDWLSDNGILVPIHTGLTAEIPENDAQFISCYLQSSEHAVGPLYRCEMAITIATPPHSHADSGENYEQALADHRSTTASVRALIEGYDATDLDTTFALVTGDAFSGMFIRDEQSTVDNERWVSTINFMYGIRRGEG